MESTPPNPYSAPSADLYGAGTGSAGEAVSPGTLAVLAGTKPWITFMSVLMWLMVSLMLFGGSIMALVMLVGASSSGMGGFEVGVMIGTAASYVVGAFLLIYPTLKLTKYSSKIGSLSATRSVEDLNAALHEQRRYWKFMGILAIIYICFFVIIFIGLAFAGQGFAQMLKDAGTLPLPPQ